MHNVKVEMSKEIDPSIWVDEYGDYLYRYAYAQVRSKALAEDMIQEVFLSAFKAKEKFEGRSSVRTWLLSILRNKIIDHFRKHSREVHFEIDENGENVSVDSMFNSFGIWSRWLESWGGSPEQLLEEKAFLNQVYACLAKLPENVRQVFIFKNVDGMDTDEISKLLDTTANNVWVMLYRARMKLRKCVEANWISKS